MPVILVFSVICQFICIFHVVKTGQERFWIFVILFTSFLGCAIYAAMIALPDMFDSYRGQRVVSKVSRSINPKRNLRALRDALSLSDTQENRIRLADELASVGQYNEAITHYRQALTGSNAYNADTLLKLAHAQYATQNYEGCLTSLADLLAHNPGYVSQEGHLLQARALQALGRLDDAAQIYAGVIDYYAGPQARFAYAQLLQEQGKIGEARRQLEEINNYARMAPKYYRQQHRECLTQVRKMLSEIGH